jgi:hypothetical protein
MDLVTILVAAAEGAEHSKSDPIAFYIAGGALAVFAVLVGIVGIKRPTLPEGPNRAIMGIGAVLVVATMVASIASS